MDAVEDVCGICRQAYDACCPSCLLPGDDCPLSSLHHVISFMSLVWGKCHHCFHMHCCLTWLAGKVTHVQWTLEQSAQATTQTQCPMCRQEWETADK